MLVLFEQKRVARVARPLLEVRLDEIFRLGDDFGVDVKGLVQDNLQREEGLEDGFCCEKHLLEA